MHGISAKPFSCSPLSSHPAGINSRVHVHEPLHMWWSLHMSWRHGPCEDHFGKMLSKQPTVGPIIVSEPCKHVSQYSDGHWSTSVPEANFGHLPVHICRAHVLAALSSAHCMYVNCWSHASRVNCVDCFACVGLLSCIAHLDHAGRIACVSFARYKWST